MEKTISFVVGKDGTVTCGGSRRPQCAGVQGDDKLCTLEYDLSAVYTDNANYFIEIITGRGEPLIFTGDLESRTVDNNEKKILSFKLDLAITADGGRAEIHIVEEVLDHENMTTREGNTYVSYIYFQPKDNKLEKVRKTAYGIFEDCKKSLEIGLNSFKEAEETLGSAAQLKDSAEKAAEDANSYKTAAEDAKVKVGEAREAVDDAKAAAETAASTATEKAQAALTSENNALEYANQAIMAANRSQSYAQSSEGVRYNEVQNLTDEQKAQARENINAQDKFELTDEALEWVEKQNGKNALRIKLGGNVYFDSTKQCLNVDMPIVTTNGDSTGIDIEHPADGVYALKLSEYGDVRYDTEASGLSVITGYGLNNAKGVGDEGISVDTDVIATQENLSNVMEDVYGKLENKTDKTYVDNALSLKADKISVDNSLASKADTNYVDLMLNGKANKTEVDQVKKSIYPQTPIIEYLDIKNVLEYNQKYNCEYWDLDVKLAFYFNGVRFNFSEILPNSTLYYNTNEVSIDGDILCGKTYAIKVREVEKEYTKRQETCDLLLIEIDCLRDDFVNEEEYIQAVYDKLQKDDIILGFFETESKSFAGKEYPIYKEGSLRTYVKSAEEIDTTEIEAAIDNVNKNLAATQSELSTKSERQEVSNAVTNTVSGTAVRLDDVSPIPHKVKIKGTPNAAVTVLGKNLWVSSMAFPQNTVNGITTSIAEDGKVIISGTPTANTTIEAANVENSTRNINLPCGTYSHYDSTLGFNLKKVAENQNYQILNWKTTFDLDETVKFRNVFKTINNKVGQEVKYSFYPQIEIGSEVTEYEPYISPVTVTLDENGEGEVDSFDNGTMSLLCENEIEVVFNKDINKIISQQQLDVESLKTELVGKQDSLAAGDGVNIKNNILSVDPNVIATTEDLNNGLSNVYERIDAKADKSEVSNAVKSIATGTAMLFEDVSPIVHKAKITGTAGDTVNIYGKNLCNIAEEQLANPKGNYYKPIVSVDGDTLVVKARNANAIQYCYLHCEVGVGTKVKFSCKALLDDNASTSNSRIRYKFTDDITDICGGSESGTKPLFQTFNTTNYTQVNETFISTKKYLLLAFAVQLYGNDLSKAIAYYSDIQVEVGSSVTDYEAYKQANTVVLDENGQGEINCHTPNMTILADNEITATYNRDIVKVISEKQEKLNSNNIGTGLGIDDNGLPCIDDNVIVTHDILGIAFNAAYEDINTKADKSDLLDIKNLITKSDKKYTDVNSLWLWERNVLATASGKPAGSVTYRDQFLSSKSYIADNIKLITANTDDYYIRAFAYDKNTEEFLGCIQTDGQIVLGSADRYKSIDLTKYADYKIKVCLNRWTAIDGNIGISLDDSVEHFSVLTDDVLIHDAPKSQGILNAQKTARQFSSVRWTPIRNMPKTNSSAASYFPAGVEVKGLPYSSVWQNDGFIGTYVLLETFMTAVKNPNSVLYTQNLHDGQYNRATYYGCVCSQFASYVINETIPSDTTSWEKISDNTKIDEQSIYGLQIGDTLWQTGHVHVITDVIKGIDGRIKYIEITEATIRQFAESRSENNTYLSKVITRLFTAKEFVKYVTDAEMILYRNTNIKNKDFVPSPFVKIEDEKVAEYNYNTDLMIDRGNKANYKQGANVNFTAYDSVLTDYPYLLLYKDNEVTPSIIHNLTQETLTEGYSDINVASNKIFSKSGLTTGYYKACLSADSTGTDTTNFVEFCVCNITVSVSGVSNITVTFSGDNVTPLYVERSSMSGLAVIDNHILTAEELSAGEVTLNKAKYIKVFGENEYGRISAIVEIAEE